MLPQRHGPVCPGTERTHTNGGGRYNARYGPLGDGEAGVQEQASPRCRMRGSKEKQIYDSSPPLLGGTGRDG